MVSNEILRLITGPTMPLYARLTAQTGTIVRVEKRG
ncbi:MAG: hypothetical protein ACJAY2_003401 [Pseudomonadales bacterium]|jgi:hypothetical protein